MTLVMAFKCWDYDDNESIVMTADSRVSGGFTMGESTKIMPVYYIFKEGDEEKEIDLALASGAGDAGIIRQMIRIVEQRFVFHLENHWDYSHPTFEQFEEVMQESQYAFWQLLGEFEKRGGIIPKVSLIICGLDTSGKASMYEFDSRGVYCAIHDSPGYTCLGSGLVTGGSLIIKQFFDKPPTVDTALAISAYAMNVVSKVDPAVGPFEGSSFHFRIDNGFPVFGKLEEEAQIKTGEKMLTRESALKKTWDLCNLFGEEPVLARLLELLEEFESISEDGVSEVVDEPDD